jgi:hypothetical protein
MLVFGLGRGGHANGSENRHTLMAPARGFGNGARVPVSWLVAANDTYFSPDFSRNLAQAFRSGRGTATFVALAASGSEGHWLVETESGVRLAAPSLDRALKRPDGIATKKQ